MTKIELALIIVGAVAGAVWYWLRGRGKSDDETMTTQGGGGRGGLKR